MGERSEKGGRKIAVICASNMNRSMEAHHLLKSKDFANVHSFGTSSQVKLPGPAIDKPNVYEFGTPYLQIHHELERKDKDLYTQNGVLNMLMRNHKVKHCPQRWQLEGFPAEPFDILITYEDRVFDAIIEDFTHRGNEKMNCVRVVNIPTKDNHEAAQVAAHQTLQFVQMIDSLSPLEWEEKFEESISLFEQKHAKISYSTLFY